MDIVNNRPIKPILFRKKNDLFCYILRIHVHVQYLLNIFYVRPETTVLGVPQGSAVCADD